MQVIDNSYLKGVNFHENTNPMHDLKTNFDKILPIVKQTLADQLDTFGNLHAYPNRPDLPDTHIITLSLLQEALSIDSENWYWPIKATCQRRGSWICFVKRASRCKLRCEPTKPDTGGGQLSSKTPEGE